MDAQTKNLLTPKLLEWGGGSDDNFSEELQAFADRVRQAERSKFATIAEKELSNTSMLTSMPPRSSAAWNILQSISAPNPKPVETPNG